MRYRTLGIPLAAALGICALLIGVGLTGSKQTTASAASLPALPGGWPSTLQLGLSDSPGGAAAMKATTNFGFRYQYLAGGVNTGNSWANWNTNGDFAKFYIQDSIANNITPVFTYYQIRQSNPGANEAEMQGVLDNLKNSSTMAAYWADLKLFYQKAGAFPSTLVVLHDEPDMWGYVQQAGGDNAANVPASVASSGMPELAGFANNMSGFARAVIKLRDLYAPNVKVGYHLSYWGTGTDPLFSKPSDAVIDQLAGRSAAFYSSLGANFDVSFAEFSDRDADFYRYQYGNPNAWWGPADFARNVRYLGDFSNATGKRIVMWQIPLGNTKMLAENNSWGHYQDNRPEWLLDDPGRVNLNAYVNAGVVAFLFGGGAGGTTCACDGDHDGVTNPPAINGNNGVSLSADDDGGYFRAKAKAYYSAGALGLAGGGTSPTSTPTATATATTKPTSTPTPKPTNTPPPPTATPTRTAAPPTATPTKSPVVQPGWSTSATRSSASVRAGQSETFSVSVKSNTSLSALVDVEVYSASGAKVFQQYYDNQSFTGGVARVFSPRWTVPSGTATGVYTVKIGVFKPNWASMYIWNNGAATFTVTR